MLCLLSSRPSTDRDDPGTHHLSPSTPDVTEIVVPLFPQDRRPPHQGDRLLVLGAPGVFQVPELDVSEGDYNYNSPLKTCQWLVSPVPGGDEVGSILCKTYRLHLCRHLIAGNLGDTLYSPASQHYNV